MASQSCSPGAGPHSQSSSRRSVLLQSVRIVFAKFRDRLWLAVPFLAIPALWPFYQLGLGQSHDGDVHIVRLALLDFHLGHGILYPRWFPELGLGNGSPVLSYYSPSTYYIAEAWHLLGLDHAYALMVTLALLIVIAGWGAYWLASDLFGREHRSAALVAATAYMYAPYLLTNVYVRGALAEVGAQALLPWLLLCVRRLMRAERPADFLAPAVLALAALPLTHTITLVLAPLLLIPYVFVSWWQTDRKSTRLLWPSMALVLAMGIAAFFWAPMVGQRGYLSEQAYQIASEILIPENAWRWNNFLNMGLPFGYRWAAPFQLGIGQLLVALAGFLLARRRDAEWLLFALLAVMLVLLAGTWAVPFWQRSQILSIIQFPWRLLSLISLLLALLAGGIVLHIRPGWVKAGVTMILLAWIIYSNLPRLEGMSSDLLPAYSGDVTLAQIAHSEAVEGIAGSIDTVEFRPRWAAEDNYIPEPGLSAAPMTVEVTSGSAYGLQANLASATGGTLRFTGLYFPAWQVTMDSRDVLPAYPSTSLGLLTVDLPPGEHQIRLRWVGGKLERWATAASLVSLAAAAWLIWRMSSRWHSLPFILLVLLSAGLLCRTTPLPATDAPVQPLTAPELYLAGYRAEQERAGSLIIYPYWYVSSQPAWLQVRWQLRDSQGRVVNEIAQSPWFNSAHAGNWPPGTLVDDAYELPLPAGLPAGLYQLYAQLTTENGPGPLQLVGSVEVPRSVPVPQEPAPDFPVGGRFGNAVLVGYDMAVNGRRVPSQENTGVPVAVRPGDSLDYTLYWQAASLLEKDFSARIQIVSPAGYGISDTAHIIGAPLRPTTVWSTNDLELDRYHLVVPAEIAPRLYAVQLRFHEEQPQRLFDFTTADGRIGDDHVSLLPIKVAGMETHAPRNPLAVRVGEMATVLGYDLDPPEPVLHPGSQFTVTLYYRVTNPASVDYTRFLHLTSPTLGTVAQQDTYPANGENPTRAWLPGEIVADPARLILPEDAPAGEYALVAGFYDLQANLARIPLAIRAGNHCRTISSSWGE